MAGRSDDAQESSDQSHRPVTRRRFLDSVAVGGAVVAGAASGIGSTASTTEPTNISVQETPPTTSDEESAAPAPSKIRSRRVDAGRYRIQWSLPEDSCSSAVDHYRIYNDGEKVGTKPAGVNYHEVSTGMFGSTGTETHVAVVAVDAQDRISAPGETEILPRSTFERPIEPTISLAEGQIGPGAKTTAEIGLRPGIQIEELPEHNGYELSVSAPETCAVEITEIAPPAGADAETTVEGAKASMTVHEPATAYMENDEPIGTVTFEGKHGGVGSAIIAKISLDGATVSRQPNFRTIKVRDLPEPPAIDSAEPTDVDGDGQFEDISGDGVLNFPDVNRFFQRTDADAVQNNVDLFDFDEDGEITLQDVVALLKSI